MKYIYAGVWLILMATITVLLLSEQWVSASGVAIVYTIYVVALCRRV